MAKTYPEKQTALSCRNFKCERNTGGICSSAKVTLTSIGELIDHVRCVEATEPEEDDKN